MLATTVETAAGPRVDRKFWAIFALSLLLHGSLFVLTAWHRQPKVAPLPALIASLRVAESAPAARSAAPTESGSPVAAPERAAERIPSKARQAIARSQPVTAASASRPAEPANAPATPPASHGAPSAAPVETAAAPAPVAVAARPASELLDGYRQKLAALFASQHEYPRVAALRGWEGEVRLRLKVARKGNLLGVALDRSSGYEVLDQHALAMLEGHGTLPPLPEALDLGEIQVVVPIQYKLRKTT